jgi:hypothetical protein
MEEKLEIVCMLCGDVKIYGTKNKRRCPERYTHDWHPVRKYKNRCASIRSEWPYYHCDQESGHKEDHTAYLGSEGTITWKDPK